MKKQLLLGFAAFTALALTAQNSKLVNKIPAHLANKAVLKTARQADQFNFSAATATPKPRIVANTHTNKTSAVTSTVIGHTYYDLQTNSSVADRLVVNRDGSMAAAWTIEYTDATTAYANRGTGYNYNNGTGWAAEPTARIENVRVGWGNIVNTRGGKDLVLSHAGGASKLNLASRTTKGTGTWANSTTAVPTATTGGNFWPRMVSSSVGGGDTIYAISLTYPVGSGGALWQGLDGAVVFSRSINGGVTWDITNQVPTGLTSASFKGFGGDAYAIAANGPVVAIVAGDTDRDVVMTKSTDGGVTWSSRTIYKCPITKWDHTTTTSNVYPDGNADTLETNDGTFAIALDNNNMAYVFFGRMRILQDAIATTQTYSYYPSTDGLYMWKESMADGVVGANETDNGMSAIIVASIEDVNFDNNIKFATPAVSTDNPFGSYGCSLTSFPSAAFDSNNNLYLSYSSIVDSLDNLVGSGKNVRHIYVNKSFDGGIYWCGGIELDKIVDPANDVPYEAVYGSMAKNVDGKVHLIYMRDLYPGYGVGQTTVDLDNQGDLKEIVYSDITDNDDIWSASWCLEGIKLITNFKVSTVNFYPNPASTNGTLEINLTDKADMNLVVTNAVGQVVYTSNVAGNSGLNKVNLNLSNFNNGLYFLTVNANNSKSVVTKFVVSK